MLGRGKRGDLVGMHRDCRAAMSIARGDEGGCHVVSEQGDAGGVDAVRDRDRSAGAVAGKAHGLPGRKIDVGEIDRVGARHAGDGAGEAGGVVEPQRPGVRCKGDLSRARGRKLEGLSGRNDRGIADREGAGPGAPDGPVIGLDPQRVG
ncbi:hypothetical protein NS44R_15090, partial [Mammaliicoccus sciuri]